MDLSNHEEDESQHWKVDKEEKRKSSSIHNFRQMLEELRGRNNGNFDMHHEPISIRHHSLKK